MEVKKNRVRGRDVVVNGELNNLTLLVVPTSGRSSLGRRNMTCHKSIAFDRKNALIFTTAP